MVDTNELVSGIRENRVRWVLDKKGYRSLCQNFHARPRIKLEDVISARALRTARSIPSHLLSLRRKSLFSFPAFDQITDTLRAIEMLRIDAIMVLPVWRSAPWYSKAAQLATSMPFLLDPTAFTPRGQTSSSKSSWQWIGVRLSGAVRKRRAFRHLASFGRLSDQAPGTSTREAGGPYDASLERTLESLRTFVEKAASAKR